MPRRPPRSVLANLIWKRREKMRQAKEAGQQDKERRDLDQRAVNLLEDYKAGLVREDAADAGAAMDAGADLVCPRRWSAARPWARRPAAAFDNAFRFLEQTFGDSQELVLFVTEITAGYDTSWFVENFGCDAYFRHNRELLFDDTRHRIREEIAAAKAAEREEQNHGGDPENH